jgi:toxin YoeB
MEVFFNELSCTPVAPNKVEARNKIIKLLETLKSIREDGFNVMRTAENFYTLHLSNDYTFVDFFNDPSVNRDLKTLFKGVTKRPYLEDDTSLEAEMFILSQFHTQDENGDAISPEGLAIAYVSNSPAISLTGNVHWEREFIPLSITYNDDKEHPITENVVNVHSETSIKAEHFRTWLKSLVDGIQLDREENIVKVFPSDKFSFEARASKDLISWYYDDKRFIVRIKELIYDIVDNPYKGGKGHTETLGGTGGRASKRIIKKDRIVYTYTENLIVIHQCRGHYDDK